GLKAPQLLACARVERQEVAIRLTAEEQAPGCDHRATPAPNPIRCLVLPGNLVRLAVNSCERATHQRVDRRSLAATDVELPQLKFIAEAREGTGADSARHIEITRVGAIRHRRPVRATDP